VAKTFAMTAGFFFYLYFYNINVVALAQAFTTWPMIKFFVLAQPVTLWADNLIVRLWLDPAKGFTIGTID